MGREGTGREEIAKRANEKGGRRQQKSAKRGHLPMGNTKKVFFDSCLHIEGVPLHLSSVVFITDGGKRLFYFPESAMLFIQNTCDFFESVSID